MIVALAGGNPTCQEWRNQVEWFQRYGITIPLPDRGNSEPFCHS
jgi:hypothetical protein